MNTIQLLEQNISETYKLLFSYENRLTKEPANFALRLTLQSLRTHLNELQTQYREANELSSTLLDDIEHLKPQYFVDFLLLMGWIPITEGEHFREYQAPHHLGLPSDYFLEVPKESAKNVWQKYAIRIVEMLSKIYHCTPEDLQIVLKRGHHIFSMGITDKKRWIS